MAARLYSRQLSGESLTADRSFYSFGAWALAVGTGAALLWRADGAVSLRHTVKTFGPRDGR